MQAQAKVYSYSRISTGKQADGTGIERQAAYAAKWAKAHGIELDTRLSLVDLGLSAFHGKHVAKGALGAFLKLVDAGKIAPGSVLVVESLDRLSRAEPLDALDQMTGVIKAGVRVVTALDDREYSRESLRKNPSDLLGMQLVMMRAHEESKTKRDRVTEAAHLRCRAWVEGTYRGVIGLGRTPGWVRRQGDTFVEIPERVSVLRGALDAYLNGSTVSAICAALLEADLSFSTGRIQYINLYELLSNPVIMGTKTVKIEDKVYALEGYYPAAVSRETFDAIQRLLKSKARNRAHQTRPSIVTGMQIGFCGYCGCTLRGQDLTRALSNAGRTPRESARRLGCMSMLDRKPCASNWQTWRAMPVERAIMRFCSDQINFESLYSGDAAALTRQNLVTARAALEQGERKVARVLDAIAESDDKPTALVQRLRDLEREVAALRREVATLVDDLTHSEGAQTVDAHAKWAALADGVLAMDDAARMQARELVAATFERITVFGFGLVPNGTDERRTIHIQLKAKGSTVVRTLDVDGITGDLIEGADVTIDAPAMPTRKAKPAKQRARVAA